MFEIVISTDDEKKLGRRPHVLPPQTVQDWKKGCEQAGDLNACYNLGVQYAAIEHDEAKALPFYRRACQGDHGPGCANLGGLLIKQPATRDEGIASLRKACAISKNPSSKADPKLSVACVFADAVERYKNLPYSELIDKAMAELRASHAPRPTAETAPAPSATPLVISEVEGLQAAL